MPIKNVLSIFKKRDVQQTQQAQQREVIDSRYVFSSDNRMQKIFVPSGNEYSSLVDILTFGGNFFLAAVQCVNYYRRCAPLYNALDTISRQMMQINPVLVSRKEEDDFVQKHPVLDLLHKPNPVDTWSQFIYQLSTYYYLTGNAYIVATGKPNKIPLELQIIRPQMITAMIGIDGYTDFYQLTTLGYVGNTTWAGLKFYRKEIDGRFRYFSDDGEREIYHIHHINPVATSQLVYGMSPLNPLFYEIEQYISASIHNLSMLRRGAFPSGFFVSEQPISTDEQRSKLQQDIDAMFAGSHNAGRAGLLEGGMKFEAFSMNNKDMEFSELRKAVQMNIYSNMRIPLPIVSTDHMTLSNLESSKLMLYDDAVLPLTNFLFEQLSMFLLDRVGLHDEYEFGYDEGKIIPLEPRRNAQLEVLKNSGLYTINELRMRAESDALAGGNVIYGPQGTKIIAVDETDPNELPEEEQEANEPDDQQTGGPSQNPITSGSEASQEGAEIRAEGASESDDVRPSKKSFSIKTDRDTFVEKLKIQFNKDGSRRYTDEDIKDLLLEIYGQQYS